MELCWNIRLHVIFLLMYGTTNSQSRLTRSRWLFKFADIWPMWILVTKLATIGHIYQQISERLLIVYRSGPPVVFILCINRDNSLSIVYFPFLVTNFLPHCSCCVSSLVLVTPRISFPLTAKKNPRGNEYQTTVYLSCFIYL